MHARVIDEHLDGPFLKKRLERLCRRQAIDNIETGHGGGTAACDDPFGNVFGRLGVSMSMHDHGTAIGR
jgi:hypothetical protein